MMAGMIIIIQETHLIIIIISEIMIGKGTIISTITETIITIIAIIAITIMNQEEIIISILI